ncbi:hypothetical protein LQ327_09795 [Actinomycetospora endophytica]|uniref:Uncharacterized protein n=1 Tax=Actinomycetospora endophytica TaxID=2291215 RepID=A0ABS8P6V7_9PSEU|nr:hypothetical protein [Actinomycetospora endophytica]MCD2193672.1 hypothetical protein [Actinomycetospora endophytica]
MSTHRETVRAVGAELDALVVRLGRLAQAGMMTSEHRETLHAIAGQLHDIRLRLRGDARQADAVTDAVEQVAADVDDVANTHHDCVYGPVLAELAGRTTAIRDLIT